MIIFEDYFLKDRERFHMEINYNNEVTKFLKSFAKNNGFEIYDSKFGILTYDPSTEKFDMMLNAGKCIWNMDK